MFIKIKCFNDKYRQKFVYTLTKFQLYSDEIEFVQVRIQLIYKYIYNTFKLTREKEETKVDRDELDEGRFEYNPKMRIDCKDKRAGVCVCVLYQGTLFL